MIALLLARLDGDAPPEGGAVRNFLWEVSGFNARGGTRPEPTPPPGTWKARVLAAWPALAASAWQPKPRNANHGGGKRAAPAAPVADGKRQKAMSEFFAKKAAPG